MLVLSLFYTKKKRKENRRKINITPYGENFYKLTYWDKD